MPVADIVQCGLCSRNVLNPCGLRQCVTHRRLNCLILNGLRAWLLKLDSNPPPLKLRRAGQQPSG